MAGDRDRYNRALRHWDDLRTSGELSLPAEKGVTAIVCALPNSDRYRHNKDTRIFRKEAFAIADLIRKEGGMPEVVINPTSWDILKATEDPTIASIISIGHGSLGELEIGDEVWSWEQVAHDTDHLKQGVFEQRQCGGTSCDLNVPLGTFMVDNHQNVLAAVNVKFAPSGLQHPANDHIRPVFDEPRVTYDQVKAQLPKTEGFSA